MSRQAFLNAAAIGTTMLSAGLPAAAEAQTCLSVYSGSSPPTTITDSTTGTTYCSVSMSAYTNSSETCNGYTSGGTLTHNGSTYTVLCQADFKAAMTDAGTYFASNSSGTANAFRVSLLPGMYAVPDTTPYSAIPLPVYNGTLAAPVSATERLVLEGGVNSRGNSTSIASTLLTMYELQTIVALPSNIGTMYTPQPFSHLTVANMVFDRDQFGASQGSLVSGTLSVTETLTSIVGTSSTTSTMQTPALQMVLPSLVGGLNQPGFNTPDFGFDASGSTSPVQLLRIYDNVSTTSGSITTLTPMLDSAVNNGVLNYQVSYHGVCGTLSSGTIGPLDSYLASSAGTTTTASFSCPSSGTNTITLLLGSNPGTLSGTNLAAVSSYPTLTTQGAAAIVCVKNEGHSGNFLNIDNSSFSTPATDIVLYRLTWMGGTRAWAQNTADVSVTDSSIVREPAALTTSSGSTYQLPCLSSDSGGPQIDGSAGATYGNVISGFSATATGDDSLAILGDIGGTTSSSCGSGTCTVSTVTTSTISDSFARGVLIVPASSQPTADQYLSFVDVWPYTGYGGTINGSFCTGGGYGGNQGYDTAIPYPTSASGCPSGSNVITDIYSACPYYSSLTPPPSGSTSATTNVFCPVRVYPIP